jgi:hypothetical protein
MLLYEKAQCTSGLYIGKKIKLEHLRLTSYSRMNVRLAVQVGMHSIHADCIEVLFMQSLSKSVADSFPVMRELDPENGVWKETVETERFCQMFNRFFDCLNISQKVK